MKRIFLALFVVVAAAIAGVAQGQDEMKDCPNTNEMFKEYGMVANFVLSNRQIAYKLADELQQGST